MKQQILAILFAVAATPAAAYTSYLKPDAYWPQDDSVRVEGAYASQFFTPQIALPARLTVTGPTGAALPFDRIAVEGAATHADADLHTGGTYRISTGEQLGAPTALVGVDGQWRPLAQGETAPEGAPVTTLQTVTLAEVYVTRGAASRTVVDQTQGRLAIRPITHPNQVLAAQGLQVQVLFDGAPLANTAVVLYAAGDADNDLDTFAVTDANGNAAFTFAAPGHFVIAARHRANMAPGGAAQIGSYTTTLTFEALAALPAEFNVAQRAEEEARQNRPRRRMGPTQN